MRTRSWYPDSVAVLGLLVFLPADQGGDLVVGNLDQPLSVFSPDQILPYLPLHASSEFTAAQQFTTAPTSTSLDRIFASLGNLDTGMNGSFTLTAKRIADKSRYPTGSGLANSFTFNVGSIPTSGFVSIELDPTGSFTLAANTAYWFSSAAATETPALPTTSETLHGISPIPQPIPGRVICIWPATVTTAERPGT